METSRRTFLAASTSAAVLGANDRIRIGVVGNGGRGKYLMKELQKIGGIEFVAVCDIWDRRRDEAAQVAGSPVKKFNDHRELLDLKDIDAVIVATPDHWHAAAGVDACKAGKDIYVEKPMVHHPEDGQALVKAVRQNNRICAVGTQARALPHYLQAREKYIQSGVMGKVGLVRTWYTSNTGYILTPPPGMERKPDGLDWERYCGPSKHVPWNPDIYFSPYKWRNYDGGMIMGIAIHVLDSAHHLLGLTHPQAAMAYGGVMHYDDGRDTPDAVSLLWEYPGHLAVTFDAEVLTAPGVKTNAGVMIRGQGGTLRVDRYAPDQGYVYTPNDRFSKLPPERMEGPGATASYLLQNWLQCLRTRQQPMCTVENGYYSAMACHLAMLAYEKQDRVRWNPKWDLPA